MNVHLLCVEIEEPTGLGQEAIARKVKTRKMINFRFSTDAKNHVRPNQIIECVLCTFVCVWISHLEHLSQRSHFCTDFFDCRPKSANFEWVTYKFQAKQQKTVRIFFFRLWCGSDSVVCMSVCGVTVLLVERLLQRIVALFAVVDSVLGKRFNSQPPTPSFAIDTKTQKTKSSSWALSKCRWNIYELPKITDDKLKIRQFFVGLSFLSSFFTRSASNQQCLHKTLIHFVHEQKVTPAQQHIEHWFVWWRVSGNLWIIYALWVLATSTMTAFEIVLPIA